MSHPSATNEWKPESIPSLEEEKLLPKVKSLFDLKRPESGTDPNELLKNRFLCKGGGLILTGQTGIGKSSLIMQLALHWIAGKSVFGLIPAKPLKILMIQAENDEADLAEMRDGVISGLSFKSDFGKEFSDNLKVCTIDDKTAIAFAQCLESLLEGNSYDLVLIDPLFAYCGGNVSDQAVISSFLRGQINPLLHKFNVGCIFVHHVNKPPTGKDRPVYGPTDFAYIGSGSSELANWMRAGILLYSLGKTDVFELRLTKRASRAGWKDDSGQPSYTKLIRHSRRPGMICWDELTDEEGRTLTTPPEKDSRVPSLESFLTIFPTVCGNDFKKALLSSGQIQNAFRTQGWLKDAYKGLCDTALAQEKLGLIDRLPRNQKLYGLPHFVESYKTFRLETNTILEQPAFPNRSPVKA